MTDRVEFYRHHLGAVEVTSVTRTIESLFLTTGPRVREFEQAFAQYLGVPQVVGVASCTQGLSLVLHALGVGAGDEVITTPQTFIATANAIVHTGATVVFADVDPTTGNLDPQAVREALSEKTRAIVPVHLYGQLCDMPALRAIADEAGVALVEDAAHCVEGRSNIHSPATSEIGPGQLGDAACFSFYATKNLTCGEGGAIATRDADLARTLVELRLHGMSGSAADRYTERRYKHWDMVRLGYKANLTDLQAALLLPQLAGIDARLARREAVAQRYERALEHLPGISYPRVLTHCRSARHLFTLWIGGSLRDDFLADMAEQGIGVAVNYRAVHLLSYYREQLGHQPGAFPNAERIGDQTASIPLYPLLSDDEVTRVIDSITRWAVAHESELSA